MVLVVLLGMTFQKRHVRGAKGLPALKIGTNKMKEIEDLENRIKEDEIRQCLHQFSLYLTTDQANWIQEQIRKREELRIKTSFSNIVRECIDNGFQAVSSDTDALTSMRKRPNL